MTQSIVRTRGATIVRLIVNFVHTLIRFEFCADSRHRRAVGSRQRRRPARRPSQCGHRGRSAGRRRRRRTLRHLVQRALRQPRGRPAGAAGRRSARRRRAAGCTHRPLCGRRSGDRCALRSAGGQRCGARSVQRVAVRCVAVRGALRGRVAVQSGFALQSGVAVRRVPLQSGGAVQSGRLAVRGCVAVCLLSEPRDKRPTDRTENKRTSRCHRIEINSKSSPFQRTNQRN